LAVAIVATLVASSACNRSLGQDSGDGEVASKLATNGPYVDDGAAALVAAAARCSIKNTHNSSSAVISDDGGDDDEHEATHAGDATPSLINATVGECSVSA